MTPEEMLSHLSAEDYVAVCRIIMRMYQYQELQRETAQKRDANLHKGKL